MKTDMRGGAPAEDEATDRLEERLAGRFAIELGRAERDYPALRAGRLRTPEPRRRGIWPRLAVSVTTIGVLAALVVVGVGLAWQPAAPPVAPARSGAVLGADGIPDQIDGQHVYRLAAQGDWQDLSGSFLLGAYAVDAPIPCAPPLPSAQPQGSSENAFVPQCGTVELVPQAQDNSEWFFNLAPRGLDVLTKWLNGPAIVMRVHTHDPGASGCSADQKTACEAAVVVEAVVWSGSNSPSPTPTDAVLAADGIPAQIGGEHVYRLSEALPNGSGSFLLGGYPVNYPISCPSARPLPTAEADLVGQCGGTHLASSAGQRPGSGLFTLAPRGSDLLTPWLGGPAVVIRAHTHDAAAASCSADTKAACEAAVVVESVVWPEVPTQIAGERVYRAADQASFPTSGSFLLGGPVTMPEFMPPCPMPIDHTTAENDLIPYCYWEAIDGIHVAPKVDALANLSGRIVVARVHIGDAEAASCPISIQLQCKTAVVVEEVVWTGGAASSSPNPNPTPQTTPNSASSEAIGPAATDQIGPDGVPITLDGQPVYRAANLPAKPIFFLGGKLTSDTACAAPATPAAQPSACGYWMIDGVRAVGTSNVVEPYLTGQAIVAQVEVGRALAICPGGSCTKDTYVILSIVWPLPPVATPPAPLTP